MTKLITYNLVRKIHLYAAFSILSFVFMYFVTGFILSHDWISRTKSKDISKQFSIKIPRTIRAEEMSVYLQNKFNIHAKRDEQSRNNDGSIDFKYFKPGTFYTLTLSPDSSLAVLRTEQFSPSSTAIGFHRINGYGGGWLYDLYVLMMDLASIATILFGLTGLYLWYKLMRKKMTWGIIILSLGIGYTILVISLFM